MGEIIQPAANGTGVATSANQDIEIAIEQNNSITSNSVFKDATGVSNFATGTNGENSVFKENNTNSVFIDDQLISVFKSPAQRSLINPELGRMAAVSFSAGTITTLASDISNWLVGNPFYRMVSFAAWQSSGGSHDAIIIYADI